MESNPESIRTEGKMCSKGQAGLQDVYFPDRILYPMKRVGERGEGKWERLTWDDALTEVADKFIDCAVEDGPESITYAMAQKSHQDDLQYCT